MRTDPDRLACEIMERREMSARIAAAQPVRKSAQQLWQEQQTETASKMALAGSRYSQIWGDDD